MLASLLPGLRDVRIPLTVGYLWLLFAWLLWGNHLPDERPTGDGPIARIFDLSDFLGNASILAAISFTAYVLGAVVTIPVEGVFGPILVRAASFTMLRFDSDREYYTFLRSLGDRAKLDVDPQSERKYRYTLLADYEVDARIDDARAVNAEQLRPRLLASGKTEVYGEYDRLSAEGAFRINLVLPLTALGLYAGHQLHWAFYLATPILAAVLLTQGARRVHGSWTTLQRAAIVGVFKHPLEEELDAIWPPELDKT